MNDQLLSERLFETLITGDRVASRLIVDRARQDGYTPERLISEVFWPTYENLERLHRADNLTRLAHHMATRLLRVLSDQVARDLDITGSRNRSVFAVCGPSEGEELGAQMAVDLLEGAGFEVTFAGGGVAADEILQRVQETHPDVLLTFASAASDLPDIRQLIDTIREIGACDSTQIAVGGGVFNRAEGLAEEIGADIWAVDPLEMVDTLIDEPERRAAPDQRTVGKTRRKRAA